MGSLVLLALSLSLDAGTAAICCGLGAPGFRARDGVRVGLWFGLFQAGMTLAGAAAGSALSGQFARLASVVSFGLLLWLGLRMLLDALTEDEAPAPVPVGAAKGSGVSGAAAAGKPSADLGAGTLAPLAVATSLDALAAGVGVPLLGVGVWAAAAVIGGTAFAVSLAGSLAGRELGRGTRRAAGCLGGAALIGIGVKILLGG